MLRFLLLGPFDVFRDDGRIPVAAFRTKQTRSVLKVLLAEHDRPVPFARLADVLWPESDADTARNSLQVAIRTLRRVFEPNISRGSESRYIATDGEAYRFVATDCWIDVDEFVAQRQAGIAAERHADAAGAVAAYRSAASIYRGQYLADDVDAEWALATRERLREAFLDVADRLARLLAKNEQGAEALNVVERALREDPLREDLYLLLMRLHAASGRRAHALAAFERSRRVLRAELGVEPGQRLTRLRDDIVAGRAKSLATTTVERGAPDQATIFVGRDRELALMRETWARAAGEAGHLVVLVGDAGEGKTRLAQHFAERLGPDGQVAWLAAHESEQDLPFGPAMTFLANWLEHAATKSHLERLGPSASALGHLLPQVRLLWPECPDLPTGAPEHSHQLEALTAAVLARKGRGRGLIVMDDAQWADDDTLRWLAYALHRWPAGVLTLAILRPGEGRTDRLERLRSDARRRDRLLSIEVGPLTAIDIERLVTDAAASPGATSELARRLHAVTRGNALFVVEAIRDLPRLASSGKTPPTPASVRDAILARVARLPAAPGDVLRAMSVASVPCEATFVGAITERTAEEVIDALDVLLARRIVRVQEEAHGYVIDHPLVMRVVYEAIGPARREALHRRAASALLERRANGGAAASRQILRHLAAAGADADEIARFADQAGAEAMSHLAYAEAVECYTASRDAARRLPRAAETTHRVSRAIERLGEALWNAGRLGEARVCYAELLETTADPVARAGLLRKTAWCLVESRFDEALDLLAQAERELGERADVAARIERGRILGVISIAHFYRSDYPKAIEAGDRALALWRELPGLERDTMEQLLRVAPAWQRMGRLDAAEDRLRDAQARARGLGDVVAEARAAESLAQILQARGKLGEAMALHEWVMRTHREYGVPRFEMIGLLNRGWLLTDVGDLTAARAAYEESLARAEALDLAYWVMHVGVGLGGVEARLGDPRARRTLGRAIDLADEIGNRQRKGHAYIYLGELALGEGDAAGARTWAERALAIAHDIADSHGAREGYALLAHALVATGDAAAAADAARAGLERAAGFPLSQARNLVALARARWDQDQRDGAIADLALAETIFRQAGARFDLARLLLARADTVSPGRPRAAILAQALDLATATGSRPLLTRIREATASAPR